MTTETDNVFGNWLKSTLHTKRMSGGEFAQKAKLSRSAVYFFLGGGRVPDEESLARIVAALGVSLESVPSFRRKPVGRRKKASS